jgi:hypothetical protein
MVHQQKQHYDPFQWVSRAHFYGTFVGSAHFQFLGELGRSWLLFISILCLLHFCLNAEAKTLSKRLLPPYLLIWVAMLLSAYVSWVSFKHHYWILPRQWVASLALIPVAFIWLCAELTNLISRVSTVSRWLIPVLCLAVIAYNSYPQTIDQSHSFLTAILNRHSSEHFVAPLPDALRGPGHNDEWVALANQNVESGGPVSPFFQRFYGGSGK